MPHVVACHLGASSTSTHQAGMHRPEAAKIDPLRNVVRLRNLLQMPKDTPPFRRRPFASCENEVVRLPMLRLLPDTVERSPMITLLSEPGCRP